MVLNKEGGPWKAEKGRMQSTERMAFDKQGSTCHSRKEGHLAADVCGSELDAEIVLFSLFLLFLSAI